MIKTIKMKISIYIWSNVTKIWLSHVMHYFLHFHYIMRLTPFDFLELKWLNSHIFMSFLDARNFGEFQLEHGCKLSRRRRIKWVLNLFRRLVNLFYLFRRLVNIFYLFRRLIKPFHFFKRMVEPFHLFRRSIKPFHLFKRLVKPCYIFRRLVKPFHLFRRLVNDLIRGSQPIPPF